MTATFACPQCGEDTPSLFEGYCEPCRDDNQTALDLHNAQHDAWRQMSGAERWAAIKHAGGF